MPEKPQPTQRTGKGYEIPVPTREQVMADLAKAAEPVEKPKNRKHRKRKPS